MRKIKVFRQLDSDDCGPSCLLMLLHHLDIAVDRARVRSVLSTSSYHGTSIKQVAEVAEAFGTKSTTQLWNLSDLRDHLDKLPAMLHWRNNHFVVLFQIKDQSYHIADPARGTYVVSEKEFLRCWLGEREKGAIMYLSPNAASKNYDTDNSDATELSFVSIIRYILSQRGAITQVIIALFVSSVLQFAAPFLTRSVVDVGINTKDVDFITLILFAQVFLFLGRSAVDFLKGWILVHLSTRINLQLVFGFLRRLLSLPISFFESRRTGDTLQRIGDQSKIEQFLTNTSLTTIFSIFNFSIMSIVLAMYNWKICLVFLISVIIYSIWILYFQRARGALNEEIFSINSQNQSKVIQLITGINDIKINNCEQNRLDDWMEVQRKSFRLGLKSMAVNQYQQAGGLLINESKNILITFLSAKAVIDGELTFGTMLAIQYIIGQLNSPIEQLVTFLRSHQDARLSLERLNEVYQTPMEDHGLNDDSLATAEDFDIAFEQVSFSYPHSGRMQIDDLCLKIPHGKVTAIVGSSGSGKTTLLKLILKFHKCDQGVIKVANRPLSNVHASDIRKRTGVVLQDSYIFTDTILKNITLFADKIDEDRLMYSMDMACITGFVKALPLGLRTVIGSEGISLSQGQKQRILIARAIYKDPKLVLLDEATNSLDTVTEHRLVENLSSFFAERTVIVVAHRLSTVVNADQIIVLENGKIVETGSHVELISLRGSYFTLVRNQLELSA